MALFWQLVFLGLGLGLGFLALAAPRRRRQSRQRGGPEDCPNCSGRGYTFRTELRQPKNMPYRVEEWCYGCSGKGWV